MRLMIALFAFAALSFGQQPDLKTIPGSTYGLFQLSSNFVLRAAEKMPEEHYSFKPVDNVRSFGELVAHVGDSQYFFCGPVNADGKKSPGIEKTAKTKTAIIAGLKEAFAYCDMAYKQTTDAQCRHARQLHARGACAGGRAELQQRAHLRALRKSRHLYADEGSGASLQ
jgi:hypothetical protein